MERDPIEFLPPPILLLTVIATLFALVHSVIELIRVDHRLLQQQL